MHETYRMLGQEHEADLEREADKLQHAAQVHRRRRSTAAAPTDVRQRQTGLFARTRIVSFLARAARDAS